MKKKKRFFWHLFPYFIGIILFSVTLLIWYSSNSIRGFYLDQTESDLKIRARLLAQQLTPYIISSDSSKVNQACRHAGNISAARVTVILPNGEVIGDSDAKPAAMDNHGNRPELIKALDGSTGTSIRFSKTLNQNMMYVAIPLMSRNDLVGALRTSISISKIDANLDQIKDRTIVGGFLIAFLVAWISLLISQRISRPVENIKRGAARFAKGDLDYKIASPEIEELSELAQTLNQMAQRLDERIKTVVRQRNEFEAVLSSMVEGVVAVDKQKCIAFCNQAVANMFQTRIGDIIGKSLYHLVRDYNFQRFVALALDSDNPLVEDIELTTPDSTRTLRVQSAPLKDASAEQTGTVFVINDVTKMQQLERMRRDFAINVSHEIKTPLTAIKGFVETLLDFEPGQDTQAIHFLRIIDKNVNRLVAIVNDLRSLSRLERSDERHDIQLEHDKIKNIVEGAIQACQVDAAAKKIEIELDCAETLVAAVNPPLLERAIVNLIDNAINYSEEGGKVKIDVTETDIGLEIRVQDFGSGIAKIHHSKLFERFYRVDKSRSRDHGGTGLGLAIVKHIVMAHGGRITVDSTLGKGSCFTIRLTSRGSTDS